MPNPTIVSASLDDKELQQSIANLVANVKRGLHTMLTDTNSTVDAMEKKLKSLGNLKIDSNGTADGGSSRRTSSVEKETKARKELAMTLDQQASAINTAVQSEKKYTDEVLRQAAAIRATKEWQDKGHVVVGDVNYYDKERANVSKRDKQLLLSLEEQIVQAQQNEAEAARRAAQETRNQAQAQQQVQQSALGTAKIIENVHEMQRRSTMFSRGNASVPTFTVELESAKRLSDRLKELREQYNNMNFGQRFSKEGQAVAQQIREITRQGQILNNQLNRPTKKEVFGLSEKTLDDIAYKMRQLASYRSGLNATTQTREISSVNDEYNRLKKRMDEVMQKNQQMIASNTALGRSWNYMKNRLAFYFTVGASTSFIKNLIEVRSQYEMNERALGILVNSAERGTQIFNELSQMALVSPYTLIELSAAAKQLTAYDVAAKDVVDTTRRLADMAAAVGIPIERLTYALGQIKAYGYLNARDARMFANAGIPLVKQLSEYYTELEGRLVSTADIYDRIKKKSIGYEEVTSVIAKMTDEGGKFYDFQAKMAETLKVQLANLTLAWNNMLNAMGEESQGVLVGGISTLKQVFLHWKDIEHVLYELVVALGAYKAYQIITTRLMGTTAASLDAQVLAMKRNNAAMLEKQALTRKLTIDELRQVAAQNQVTAADYRNALSGKQLTKQKALLLAAIYKNNVQLKAALVNMGLLTTAEAASITRGKALAIVFKSIGISIRNAALAIKSFMMSNWLMFAIAGVYELIHAYTSANEHIEEINKQAAEHAKETFENIKQYLESESTINTRQRVVYKEGNPLTDSESQKAWDEMREKIELSSSASNTFVAKLMQIDNINSRLAAGFDYLRDVQRVAGVMQTLEKDAINVSSTTLGGTFGEGLKDDLVDYMSTVDVLLNKYGDMKEAEKEYQDQIKEGYIGIGNLFFDVAEFRNELRKTTDSLYDVASREGFNASEQREFFEREISEISQAEQMGAKETRIFRMQAEKEYYAYARMQLVSQLEYQHGAEKAATEKRIKDLDNEFGKNKALQESFFTWLTEKQDHAVKNMLRGKTQEEIKQGEWLKDSNAKWVEEMARKFSKEYGVSFDVLRKLVMNANTWSINIPVFFQTIGQPLSDVQRDYEARTGKKFSSNPIIKDAKTQVDIIDTLKKKQKEVANEMETARKAGGKYWEDNKQRYKEENDALVADIHAYNALTDAEEKANKKSGKGGSKKDPLLDALKQEISLVEKLQSDYDKLSKSGASQADALDTIRGAYGKTIRLLNTQLQSYGLPQIDISQLITGKDPNKALAHFKQTLNTLVSKGMLTLERSKELEAVVEKFTLSAKTYNLDMITKGLNNELGKLKDEYELAVELDANPELGDMFADMFGINTSMLPRTFGDALDRAQIIINRKLAEMNITTPFDLMEGNIDSFAKSTGLDKDSAVIKELVSAQNAYRDMFKKNITETEKILDDYIKKYGDYSDKIAEIEANRLEKLKKLNEAYYTEEMRKRPEYIAKLNAIEQGANKEKQQVDFDEFKNSRYYTMMFENLDYISTKTIRDMRDRVRELIDTMNDLTPEQLKTIISQYEKLEQKLVKRSPFKTLTKDLKEYFATSKERKAANQEFKNAQKEYDAQKKNVAALKEKYEQAKANSNTSKSYLDFLQIEINGENEILKILKEQLEAAQKKADKYNLTAKLAKSEALQVARVVADNAQSLSGFRDFLKNDLGVEISAEFDGFVDGMNKMGEGINNIISSATSGNVVGVLTGVGQTIYGIYDGIASIFGGGSAADKKITRQIEDSERAVKRLENAYKNLEYAAENAFGAATSGAQEAIKANKELQLVELKRQLALEQSRDSKHRDEDRIIEIRGQIIDLEHEIKDFTKNAVNDLLGISSHGDFFESMISEMIEAFKNGEDAMEVFEEKWSDMIDNMIMKTIVSQVLSQWVKSLERGADEILEKYTEESSKKMADLANEMTNLRTMDAGDASEWIYDNDRETFNKILESMGMASVGDMSWVERRKWFNKAWGSGLAQKIMDAYLAMLDNNMAGLQEELDKASLDATGELIDYYGEAGREFKENYLGQILDKIQENWNFGQDSEKQLSQLQQGIQGVTEDTAGALEAITNGISQQCYLQSDLLTQIRDAVVGMDMDVQVATQAQMLLQLQQSYAVQMAIQGILEGVLVPSGRAFSVELVS